MTRLIFGSCLVAITIAAACGSRSGLLSGAGGSSGSGGGQDASAGASGNGGSSGSGGSGGSGGSSGSSGNAGSAGTGTAPFVCEALSAGVATEVMSFPNRHAVAPSAVLLDAFSPARVALQAFATGGSSQLHDDIRLARYVVDDAAPAGISLELEPILAGIESHGWSTLALAPGGLREVALAWHGDPGGFGRPLFRRVDFDSWTPTATVDLSAAGNGEAVLDLAPGASTGAFGAGYAGDGYGVVWRDVLGPANDFTRPVAAVLDANGSVRIGPHEVSPPAGYPGRSPSIIWTGSTYLMATAVGACTAGTGPCVDQSIVVSRLRPASGDAVDDSGVELAHSIGVTPGFVGGRPALGRDGSLIRLAWIERGEVAGTLPARVVLTTLTPDGGPAGFDAALTPSSEPETRVQLHAADGATALIWAEDGDPSLADSAIGRSRIIVQRIDPSGQPTLVVEIASPLVHDYGSPSLIGRGSPGALLAVWSARSMIDGHDVSYAARIDCTEPSSAD